MMGSSNQDAALPAAADPPERSRAIDALRGFALLGIIVVNAPFFLSPAALTPSLTAWPDAFAFWLTNAFFTGKFFLIFSFLFGFGFAATMQRSAERPADIKPRFARRLVGLFIFGLLHATLLFFGDILMLYAVLGAVLWATSAWPPRRLLIAAGVAYLMAIVCQASILALALHEPVVAGVGYLGSFWDGARQRLSDLPGALAFIVIFNGPPALAMFWCGSALGRLGLFPPPPSARDWVGSAARAALIIGGLGGAAIAALATATPVSVQTAGEILWLAAAAFAALAPILSFGLAVMVLELAERKQDAWVIRALAGTGSASLSGYLLHSVILSAMAAGWGLGYFGSVGPAGCLLLALLTFALVMVALNLWKLRFRYGPDEWLLRSFVALGWQPMLRAPKPDDRAIRDRRA